MSTTVTYSKKIKTVEVPEDLYLIGDMSPVYHDIFGSKLDGFNKEAFDILNDACVYITDDYHNIDIKGTKHVKANHSLETEGCIYVLTKSELMKVISILGRVPLHSINFHELSNDTYDYYNAIIRDYKGDVSVALCNGDGMDVMDVYNAEDGLLYSPLIHTSFENHSLYPTLIVESGFRFDYVLPPETMGYKKIQKITEEDVYLDSSCGCHAFRDSNGDYPVDPNVYTYIGNRKTILTTWEKI